ncbi:MAG: adenylate/guanylate cyclase domain-containing protein [Spirochaetia bacterium]|nr:adenylate/guanylate cyclase domain-containing protein [Spirochaetia bacterium]
MTTWISNLRLASGLFLLFYITTHFLNHSLGIFSLEWMEKGRLVFLAFWRAPGIRYLFYLALVIHLALVLWKFLGRRSLRLGTADWFQLGLGFFIPVFLFQHIATTRVMHQFYGLRDSYSFEISSTFGTPGMLYYILLPVVAWSHGMMGLNFWLRIKPWYGRIAYYFHAYSALLPVLALAGYFSAGLKLRELAGHPDFLSRLDTFSQVPKFLTMEFAGRMAVVIFGSHLAFVGLLFAGRWAFWFFKNRYKSIPVKYPDGKIVRIPAGATVLEASLQEGIPHAHVCGGRGRCSTCRVRVEGETGALPPATEEELRVLERVEAGESVRLACQLRPSGPIAVFPLLPPDAGASDGFARAAYQRGTEREIVVLFSDLRGFTKFSETKLPYDLVFVLNEYFREMGRIVEAHEGYIDKFIGDGMMAIFGLSEPLARAARHSLEAALAMSEALETFNERMRHSLTEPLRLGIGIHAGPAIVGDMGYRSNVRLTAIGDMVNTASRLESLTKDHGAELIVSKAIFDAAGMVISEAHNMEVDVRGRSGKIHAGVFKKEAGRSLRSLLAHAAGVN